MADVMTEPWTPDYGSEGPTIEGAVFQALGSASVCWENMSGTGVFQSEEAKRIGDGLLAIIAEHVAAARADEQKQIADLLCDTAFEVFTDTDGYKSIKVHLHHEGLSLAEQLVRERIERPEHRHA